MSKDIELVATFKSHIWNGLKQGADVQIISVRRTDGITNMAIKAFTSIEFVVDQNYRFQGSWKEYKGNPQFVANTVVEEVPAGEFAIVDYLKKLPGIGESIATRLYDKYGDEVFDILEESPALAAADIRGLSCDVAYKASKKLEKTRWRRDTMIALGGLLSGQHFPKKLPEQLWKAWGIDAPQRIENNPFDLLSFKGVGFIRCDNLYLKLGGDPKSLNRQAYGLQWAINEIGESSWHGRAVLADKLAGKLSGAVVNPIGAIRAGVAMGILECVWTIGVDGPIDGRSGNVQWIATRRDARDERTIAKIVNQKKKLASSWPTDYDGLSDHQAEQLRKATDARIGCLIGGPGTGKTFSSVALLKETVQRYGAERVCVAAPTGKAVVRIREVMREAGLQAVKVKTWHSLLQYQGEDNFERSEDDPFPYDFILGDESSMINARMFAYILAAVPVQAAILFVGDPEQLPPIGVGRPFADLLDSGATSVGELTEIRRNSGLIVDVCDRIRRGVEWNVPRSFEEMDDQDNICLIDARDPIGAVVNFCSKFVDDGNDLINDVQALAAINVKSGLSRYKINQAMRNHFNRNVTDTEGYPFFCYVGDKVIKRKNGTVTKAIVNQWGKLEAIQGEETYTANGEIGVVLAIENSKMFVEMAATGVKVAIPLGKLDPEKLESTGCDWELAYSISTHLSQGAEFATSVIVLDPAGARVCDRSWLYTAISRGKKRVVMVGTKEVADAMCGRQKTKNRKTFLQELISEGFEHEDQDGSNDAVPDSD